MSSGAVTVALDGRPTRVGLVRLWDVDGEAFRERVAQAFARCGPIGVGNATPSDAVYTRAIEGQHRLC